MCGLSERSSPSRGLYAQACSATDPHGTAGGADWQRTGILSSSCFAHHRQYVLGFAPRRPDHSARRRASSSGSGSGCGAQASLRREQTERLRSFLSDQVIPSSVSEALLYQVPAEARQLWQPRLADPKMKRETGFSRTRRSLEEAC